ncbi:MAG: exodeoxyribonuclease VII large subunit, partial [Mesorhizobium sp.]
HRAMRVRLDNAARRLTVEPFVRRNAENRRNFERNALRLPRVIDALLTERRRRFDQAARLAGSLSVQSVLDRGFALVTRDDGALAKRASEISSGDSLSIRFADGSVSARAEGSETPPAPPKPKTPKAAAKTASGQGSLF